MKDEISQSWQKHRKALKFGAVRHWNVLTRLRKAERECRNNESLLQPELKIFDEALFFVNCVHDWLWAIQEQSRTRRRGKALILLGRICTYAAAIRKLLTSGFEDPMRPLLRTMLETMDLFIAISADSQLNDLYAEDCNTYDDTKFWKDHITCGRIDIRLLKVLTQSGLTSKQSDHWIATRKKFRKLLSGAIHTASDSAIRSVLVFSLAHRGRVYITTYGHHSVHAPGFLHNIARMLFDMGKLVIKLMMSPNPPEVVRAGKTVNSLEFRTMLVAFLTLQDCSSIPLARSRRKRKTQSHSDASTAR